MTGRATPRLAKPFTFMEHEAARPTARRFHHQTLLAMMQTFPYMRQMRKDFLLRDAHACREFFGSRRPFQEDVDDHLTNRLRHGRSPLVDPIKQAALLGWNFCGTQVQGSQRFARSVPAPGTTGSRDPGIMLRARIVAVLY